MSDALGSVFVIGGESICKRSVVSELLTRGFDVYYGTSESNEVAAVGAQGATVHQFIDGDADSITNTVNTLLRFVSTIDGVIMMPEPGLFGSVEEADVFWGIVPTGETLPEMEKKDGRFVPKKKAAS